MIEIEIEMIESGKMKITSWKGDSLIVTSKQVIDFFNDSDESPSDQSNEVVSMTQEIERLKGLIRESFVMINKQWGKTLEQIDTDWEKFEQKHNL